MTPDFSVGRDILTTAGVLAFAIAVYLLIKGSFDNLTPRNP